MIGDYKLKIYNDGSHWIGIIPTSNPNAFKIKKPETVFLLKEEGYVKMTAANAEDPCLRITTPSEEFSILYNEFLENKSEIKKETFVSLLLPMFDDPDACAAFVEEKFANKKRAQFARSLRFKRKACLNNFSFFTTFTYSDEKCTFEQFDREIRIFFKNMANRYGWKVMMVPEFGAENNRFHFHALIRVPDKCSIPGVFNKKRCWNKKRKSMVMVVENSYFSDRWGKNDWQSFGSMDSNERKRSINYIIKYLTKSDNYAFYSRGIKTYLSSFVDDEDIYVPFERNSSKIVLFDNFHFVNDSMEDLGPFRDNFISLFGFC